MEMQPQPDRLYILIVSSIQSTIYAQRDWVHYEMVYETEDAARKALVDMANTTTMDTTNNGLYVDMVDVERSAAYHANGLYLLYNFIDNYCKDFTTFTSYQCALDSFHSKCDDQDRLLNDEVVRLVTKFGEKMMSSIYEYDMFDKRNILVYPDKGNRWILVKLQSVSEVP